MKLKEQLKQGTEQALESLSEGWRELRARAGALTRFRWSGHEDGKGESEVLPAMNRWAFMAADVYENHDRIVVRLEAPGMRREDFDVRVQGRMLSVQGEKRLDRKSRRGDFEIVECAYGAFRRDVPLPMAVQPDKVSASYRDGVLRVELAKAEGERRVRRSIRVN
jgi:HSP20 family protein